MTPFVTHGRAEVASSLDGSRATRRAQSANGSFMIQLPIHPRAAGQGPLGEPFGSRAMERLRGSALLGEGDCGRVAGEPEFTSK